MSLRKTGRCVQHAIWAMRERYDPWEREFPTVSLFCGSTIVLSDLFPARVNFSSNFSTVARSIRKLVNGTSDSMADLELLKGYPNRLKLKCHSSIMTVRNFWLWKRKERKREYLHTTQRHLYYVLSQSAQTWITVLPANYTMHAWIYICKVSQLTGETLTRGRTDHLSAGVTYL